MTTAVMELEARKASFVRRVLTDVNSLDTIDRLDDWLNHELMKDMPSDKQYSYEELNERLMVAEEEIAAGKTYLVEEMFDRMEKKHPWLCE